MHFRRPLGIGPAPRPTTSTPEPPRPDATTAAGRYPAAPDVEHPLAPRSTPGRRLLGAGPHQPADEDFSTPLERPETRR
ncbi:hypothetical protein ACIQU6_41670 [Streptomyces sp. NPDC090442]|uniref:hypothetical protein n=1 Tax=Streptomyces sp. NPDC090442 TaxID=3365962 RepID=UPI0037F5E500